MQRVFNKWSLCILIAILSNRFETSGQQETHNGFSRSHLLMLKAGVIDTASAEPLRIDQSFAALGANSKQHYIVQFTDSVSDQTKEAVRKLIDNDLTWYIPYNAFVVYTTPGAMRLIQQMEEITWTGIWDSKYKYEPVQEKSSKRFLVLEDDPQDQIFQLIITLPEVSYADGLIQEIRGLWSTEVHAELNCTLQIDPIPYTNRLMVSSIAFNNQPISTNHELNVISAWFAEKPEVYQIVRRERFALANYWAKSLVQNDDPVGGQDASLLFAKHGIVGQDQVIGISDSGLSSSSCFFYDPNHAVNFSYVTSFTDPKSVRPSRHRKIIQYIVPDTGDNIDEDGHGTHVAGTLAGKVLNDPDGFSKYDGISSEARIAFFDIQNGDDVELPASLDTMYFPYSYAAGARVNTNSWGSKAQLQQYTSTSQDVDKFVWDNPDMLLLFAAGNLGSKGVTPPATAKNVISVGASVSSWNMFQNIFCYSNLSDANSCSLSNYLGENTQDDLADFSSHGPTSDGRIKPDLVAPGRSLVSAGRGCLGRTDTDLAVLQGTSMATPLVASNMLLVREYLMKGFLKNGVADSSSGFSPSAALLKAIAVSGAWPIASQEIVNDGILSRKGLSGAPDNLQGFGRLKLNHVLYFTDNDFKHKTFIPRGVSGADPAINRTKTQSYTFCVAYKYSLYPPRFTLVWTDYPATLSASVSLVQDLDLIVNTNVDSSRYYGNGGTSADSLNTVERVSLPGSINPGVEITVNIKASSLPMFKGQSYALVATGRIVDTPCSVEFPGGIIPPDRYIDESLPPIVPQSLWSALMNLNVEDRRVQLILGGIAIAITAIVCCSYCAFNFDDSLCHRRKELKDNDLSSEFIAELGQQNAGANTVSIKQSISSATGRTVESKRSSSKSNVRHQRTVSEALMSTPVNSNVSIAGSGSPKNNLPPIRSARRESNLSYG